MFIFNIEAMDVKAFSALSNIKQQNLMNDLTFEVPDDRADKSFHYHHSHRRQHEILQVTTNKSDKFCKHLHIARYIAM